MGVGWLGAHTNPHASLEPIPGPGGGGEKDIFSSRLAREESAVPTLATALGPVIVFLITPTPKEGMAPASHSADFRRGGGKRGEEETGTLSLAHTPPKSNPGSCHASEALQSSHANASLPAESSSLPRLSKSSHKKQTIHVEAGRGKGEAGS